MLNVVCCSLSLPRTCLRRNQQFYSTLVAEKHTLNVCIVFVVIDETLFLSMLLYLNLLLQAVNVFWSDIFLGLSPWAAPLLSFFAGNTMEFVEKWRLRWQSVLWSLGSTAWSCSRRYGRCPHATKILAPLALVPMGPSGEPAGAAVHVVYVS